MVRLPCLESLQGKLISVEKAVLYGRVHYRRFQREVVRNTRQARNNRNVSLSGQAKADLRWWSQRSHVASPSPCRREKPNTVVTTDASLTGWGVVLQNQTWKGTWTRHESNLHINELELITTIKALNLISTQIQGDQVQFLIDNKTTCCYINRQGGTKSIRMNALARKLWLLAEELNIHLSAMFIEGKNNVIADMLSRQGQIIKAEWTLSMKTFQWVSKSSPWRAPEVDLFANAMTNRLPKYMSPCPDGQACSSFFLFF